MKNWYNAAFNASFALFIGVMLLWMIKLLAGNGEYPDHLEHLAVAVYIALVRSFYQKGK